MIKTRIAGRIFSALAVGFFMMSGIGFAVATEPPAAPGTFLGSDLLTEDAAAAAEFYDQLFGWDIEKVEDGGYSAYHQGRLIASISQITDKDTEVDASFWLVGIAVSDIDKSVDAARKLGSKVHEDVTDVPGYGRFATFSDFQGAPIMLIEPGSRPIGETKGHGSWIWAELWTNDVKTSVDFYKKVVGYEDSKIDRGNEKYHVFSTQDKYRAGIVKIPDELENVKPGWAPYVAVENLDTTLSRVYELGGNVIVGAQEDVKRGTVGLIADPAGAVLFVYEIGSAEEVKK